MRLSWSKAISLPSQPIYIPPELADTTIPPPLLDLPFNAQINYSKKIERSNRKPSHHVDFPVSNTKLLRSRSSSSSSRSSSSRSSSSSSSRSSRSSSSSSSSSSSYSSSSKTSSSSKNSYSSESGKKKEKKTVKMLPKKKLKFYYVSFLFYQEFDKEFCKSCYPDRQVFIK